MDALVAQARELHRRILEFSGQSDQCRRQRDELIARAYAEGCGSYVSLARQIGCSPELVAKVVQRRA